jgi:hypothetical protein
MMGWLCVITPEILEAILNGTYVFGTFGGFVLEVSDDI